MSGEDITIYTEMDELLATVRDRLTAAAFQKATDQAFENLHNRDEDLPPTPLNLGPVMRRKPAARDDGDNGPGRWTRNDSPDRR